MGIKLAEVVRRMGTSGRAILNVAGSKVAVHNSPTTTLRSNICQILGGGSGSISPITHAIPIDSNGNRITADAIPTSLNTPTSPTTTSARAYLTTGSVTASQSYTLSQIALANCATTDCATRTEFFVYTLSTSKSVAAGDTIQLDGANSYIDVYIDTTASTLPTGWSHQSFDMGLRILYWLKDGTTTKSQTPMGGIIYWNTLRDTSQPYFAITGTDITVSCDTTTYTATIQASNYSYGLITATYYYVEVVTNYSSTTQGESLWVASSSSGRTLQNGDTLNVSVSFKL